MADNVSLNYTDIYIQHTLNVPAVLQSAIKIIKIIILNKSKSAHISKLQREFFIHDT